MKHLRTATLLFAGVLIGALVLTGMSSGEEDAKEAKPVIVWAWDLYFNIPVMEEAARVYQKTHPEAQFEIVDFAKGDLEQKLHTMLASGQSKGLPDITLIEDYNSKKYLESYPQSFADLTGKVNHDQFSSYKVELMTVKNKVYGVPFDSGVSAMFYRTDHIAQAGYTEEDMQNLTWTDYVNLLVKYKEATGKNFTGQNFQEMGMLRIMLQSAGSWTTDADGGVNLAGNPAAAAGIQVYKDMYKTGAADHTDGWAAFVGPLNSGDHGILVTGGWILSTIKAEASQSGLWRVAPIPMLEGFPQAKNASNLGGSSWYVLEKAGMKDLAVDFLATVYENTEFYQTILTDVGAVGSFTPASTGTAYSQPDPFFGNQTVFKELTSYMEEIPPVNYGKYTYEAADALASVMLDILNEKITIDEGLAIAQSQLEGILR